MLKTMKNDKEHVNRYDNEEIFSNIDKVKKNTFKNKDLIRNLKCYQGI